MLEKTKIKQFLDEMGYRDTDVMIDDDFRAYVMIEEENGTPGEVGYDVYLRKFYLDKLEELEND